MDDKIKSKRADNFHEYCLFYMHSVLRNTEYRN